MKKLLFAALALVALTTSSCTKEEPVTPPLDLKGTVWQAKEISATDKDITEVSTLSFTTATAASMLFEQYKGADKIQSIATPGTYTSHESIITVTMNNKPAKFVYHTDRLSYSYTDNAQKTHIQIFHKKLL